MSEDVRKQGLPGHSLGRRELIKLGTAGLVGAALGGSAQGQRAGGTPVPPPAPGSMPDPDELMLHVTTGYKNNYGRRSGNGPMDDVTKQIVQFVREFDESKLTETVTKAINRTMLDTMSAMIAGFEEEPSRISARLAMEATGNQYKSTIFGYGISTTPELAAFCNGIQLRVCDFNDNPGHTSNLISAALAVGESVHATGKQMMTAIAVGYEVSLVPIGFGNADPVQAAMTAGKLMNLDEDQLANALTLALTPHVALSKGVGVESMWKDAHSAEGTKCGVWAATMARAGVTGPPQLFEGRGGLWGRDGMTAPFKLPIQERLAIERNWFKRRPAEDSSQGTLDVVADMRAWTKPEEIASIDYYMNPSGLGEIGDAPKWDPRNHETADHSMPYMLSRALLDGDIYLDSYTPEKIADPKVHELMDKITVIQVREWQGLGPSRTVIHKKNGESKAFDAYGGLRSIGEKEHPHLSDEEVVAKFNRVCAYKKIGNPQRDHMRALWSNVHEIKDVAEAVQVMAKYGQPKPL